MFWRASRAFSGWGERVLEGKDVWGGNWMDVSGVEVGMLGLNGGACFRGGSVMIGMLWKAT